MSHVELGDELAAAAGGLLSALGTAHLRNEAVERYWRTVRAVKSWQSAREGAVAECTECGQPVEATVSDGPVQVQTEHPSRVAAGEVQVVWDEEGPEGVADWIRSMAPAPGFLRVQDAIERRLRDHGAGYEDEPWFADVIDGAAAAALAAAGAELVEEQK